MPIKYLIIVGLIAISFFVAGCDQGRVRFSLKEEPVHGMGTRATVYIHYNSEKRVIYDTVEEAGGGSIIISGPIPSPDEKYVLFSFIGGECAHLVLFDCSAGEDINVVFDQTIIDPGEALGARQPLWFPDSKRFLFFSWNPMSKGGPWIYSVDTGQYEVCQKLKGHCPEELPEPHWDVPGETVTMYYYSGKVFTLPVVEK